jgi:uncharacterized surface protein with fasciclin (FAS1) repeats
MVTLSWTTAVTIHALFICSCAANYLRETTHFTRELQSLPTLDDIILSDPDLTTMAVAFEKAELVGRLCTTCNFTAFAPDNEAFAAIDQKFLATLLTPSWILHLQNLLAFHITLPTDDGNRILSTDFVDGQMFEMLNSERVNASVLKSGINLTSPLTAGSKIIEADILASNGALHKVDTVFSPGFFGVDVFALGDSFVEFSILQELMDSIGLEGIDGEFTLLAPTNEAFLALGNETLLALKDDNEALGKILANHIIIGVFPSKFLENDIVLESMGGLNITVTINETSALQPASVMFNDAGVILADILARNGIAHAIDMVLIDPDPVSDVPSDSPSAFPSEVPSDSPSDFPSDSPSDFPSESPSDVPSSYPMSSSLPSDVPSTAPSLSESSVPSYIPSSVPSDTPSDVPSSLPSQVPSSTPSDVPSSLPSDVPSNIPSSAPSDAPSDAPSEIPSNSPSDSPSDVPSASPSVAPSASPSSSPSTNGRAKKVGKTKKNAKRSEMAMSN